MKDHRLRREITATQVSNNTLHGAGSTFVFRLHEETGAPPSAIARAYTVAREVFGMRPEWREIEAPRGRPHPQEQGAELLEGRRPVGGAGRAVGRHPPRPPRTPAPR